MYTPLEGWHPGFPRLIRQSTKNPHLNSDFEPGIMVHMLKAWPGVLARKSLYAREHILIPGFQKYFDENGHRQGSLLAQCRYEHNTHHDLQGRDIAATEVGQSAAALTNTVTSAYWMLYHVFSNPVVLADRREEVQQLVQIHEDGRNTVNLAKVKSSCRILLSTWQETLRYMHIDVAARVVVEDTMLDNKYLLKKDATVMMVTPVQHTDTTVWGPTVGKFDHRRFLRECGGKRTPSAAFRAFGGGTVLYPGRHFVSTEVLSFVALLLLRYDLETVHGDRWVTPRRANSLAQAIPTPKDDVHVKSVPKDTKEWLVIFSASSRGVNVVVEDTDPGISTTSDS